MRLPRRVPWASLAELDQICNWIYNSDDTDLDATIRAINRLSAWRAITPLPHALEAVLSLLSSVTLDERSAAEQHRLTGGKSTLPTFKNNSALSVRQSYATAIVRFVNGMVDPLQHGTYARSIASIATQIGLPQWLVELRHAATHEDLPGLEVLRTGARESLAWLLHNYFLPTLSASNVEQRAPIANLSPLSPLLKQYKSLMKTISRDASLKTQLKDDLAKVLRSIERWLAEAKVASSAVNLDGWGTGTFGDGEDESERWALERLCDSLLDRGGLVPISSKKRLASHLKSSPVLPPSLVAIWLPLLSALKTNHPTLFSVLIFSISDGLTRAPSAPGRDETSKKDLSYELCLAAWAAWCVDQWETDSTSNSTTAFNRKEIIINVVSALGIQDDESAGLRRGAHVLMGLLVRSDPVLEEMGKTIISAAQRDDSIASRDTWKDADMLVMEERLNAVVSSSSTSAGVDEPSELMDIDKNLTNSMDGVGNSLPGGMPKGWVKVPSEIWKVCPIGVFTT